MIKNFIYYTGLFINSFFLFYISLFYKGSSKSSAITAIGLLIGFGIWTLYFLSKKFFKCNQIFFWIRKQAWLLMLGLLITIIFNIISSNFLPIKVVASTENNNLHSHVFYLTEQLDPICCSMGIKIFSCECGEGKNIILPKVDCVFELNENHLPTKTSIGKKIYRCKWCKDEIIEIYGKVNSFFIPELEIKSQ